MAARTPFPVSGVVYDLDGTTRLANVSVIVYDVNLQQTTIGLTNANGEYLLDLANLVSDYSAGDRVQVTAVIKTLAAGGGAKMGQYRFAVSGTSVERNIILRAGEHYPSSCYLTGYNWANSGSGRLRVLLFDKRNDLEVLRIEVPAGDSKVWNHITGISFDGGICIILEDQEGGEGQAVSSLRGRLVVR